MLEAFKRQGSETGSGWDYKDGWGPDGVARRQRQLGISDSGGPLSGSFASTPLMRPQGITPSIHHANPLGRERQETSEVRRISRCSSISSSPERSPMRRSIGRSSRSLMENHSAAAAAMTTGSRSMGSSARSPTTLGSRDANITSDSDGGGWVNFAPHPSSAMSLLAADTSAGDAAKSASFCRWHSEPPSHQEQTLEEVRELLDAVNMAIFPASVRLASLRLAAEFFDHRDRTWHDAELREGAAAVLYQKLAFIAFQTDADILGEQQGGNMLRSNTTASATVPSGDVNPEVNFDLQGDRSLSVTTLSASPLHAGPCVAVDNIHDDHRYHSIYEMALIVGCLEYVHRASSVEIESAWDAIGCEMHPLLVKALQTPLRKVKLAVQYNCQIEHANPGAVERVARTAVGENLRRSAQSAAKILAVYSLVPQAKTVLATTPGLVSALVSVADTLPTNNFPSFSRQSSGNHIIDCKSVGLQMTEACRFNAIATLTNLASMERNRIKMLAVPCLVDTIARVVHHESSDIARQCASLAIMNLSHGDREFVPELSGNNIFLEALLALLSDLNPETRRHAAISAFNLACADLNTVLLARYRDGALLQALTELVVTDAPDRQTDADEDARINAVECLLNMSCSEVRETTDRMASSFELLVSLSTCLRSNYASMDIKRFCAAALRRFAEVVHAPKAFHGSLLLALVYASQWTQTPCIADAFLSQAQVKTNRSAMVRHHGLLTGVSKLALCSGRDQESAMVRKKAVAALDLLCQEVITRPLMAQHEGVILVLTRASYGTNSTEEVEATSISAEEATSSIEMKRTRSAPSQVGSQERVRVALNNLLGLA